MSKPLSKPLDHPYTFGNILPTPPSSSHLGSQRNFTPTGTRTGQREQLSPRLWVSAFDLAECLHKTDGRVRDFGQGEVLADADSWSAVEGEVGPAWSEGICVREPSFWFEVFGVGAVDVLPSVHGVEVPCYVLAFGDEDG